MTHICFELDKLQASAVHDDHVHLLWRILLRIGFRRFENVGRMLSLYTGESVRPRLFFAPSRIRHCGNGCRPYSSCTSTRNWPLRGYRIAHFAPVDT